MQISHAPRLTLTCLICALSMAGGPAVASAAPPEEQPAVPSSGAQHLEAGKWTMVAGASTIGAGLIIFGAAFAGFSNCLDFKEGTDCGHEERAITAGAVIVPIGALVLIAGGATYGVGKRRENRARAAGHVRVLPRLSASRRGVSFGLAARF